MPNSTFNLASTFELKPVYISLGIPKTSFAGDGGSVSGTPFDAAVDGGLRYPDSIWLFRGEDCYRFNVKNEAFEDGPLKTEGAFGEGWPGSFSTGVDAATWGGPAYPDLYYYFKGSQILRFRDSIRHVDAGPMPIVDGWGGYTGGTPFADGVDTALHGVGVSGNAQIGLFRGNQYLKHDLNTGSVIVGPVSITEAWGLPEPFASGIDLAFYGTGREAEMIYFVKGDQCILYDSATRTVTGAPVALEERFPAMAQFLPKPQIFLEEKYSLDTFFGQPTLGRLVDTVTLLARAKKTYRVVTETVESTTSTVRNSVLDSQDASVVQNFYDEMKTASEDSGGSDSSRYHLDASFHGDASWSGLGGEVNANLHAKGGTDSVRSAFAKSALGAVSQQVNKSSRQLKQRVMDESETYISNERTVHSETFERDNSGNNQNLVSEFYQQIQPYLALLVLRNVRVAFADGSGRFEVTDLHKLDKLLADHIEGDGNRADVKSLIVGELSTVSDYQGTPRATLKETTKSSGGHVGLVGLESAAASYQFDPRLTTEVHIPDGTTMTIAGIVIDQKLTQVPTGTVTPVDKTS